MRHPSDERETVRRLRALARRFPDDDEIARDLANFLDSSADVTPEARLAEATASGGQDPEALAQSVPWAQMHLDRLDDTLGSLERCVAKNRGNLHCTQFRSIVYAFLGKCALAEADARHALTMEPTG